MVAGMGCSCKVGKQMSRLPVDPSLARALLAAASLGCLPDMITVAAMLSADSIFYGGRCGVLFVATTIGNSRQGTLPFDLQHYLVTASE
jgi:HrpA-like RNA helicase